MSGDLGKIEIWSKGNLGWLLSNEVNILGASGIGSEGMAINPASGDIYLGEESAIHILDKSGSYKKRLQLKFETKPGRSLSEYLIAGMDFYDGILFVLTEYHSAILAVDPESGNIQRIFVLEGITEGAGLTVTETAFYVVVDHELNQPSPGVHVYSRPSGSDHSK